MLPFFPSSFSFLFHSKAKREGSQISVMRKAMQKAFSFLFFSAFLAKEKENAMILGN